MNEMETTVYEQEEDTTADSFSVCVGERYACSCSHSADDLSVRKITVLLTDMVEPFHIYVVPTETSGTYVAWMHSPGETIMTRMFSVQQPDDWEIEKHVVFHLLQDLVELHEREDASRE